MQRDDLQDATTTILDTGRDPNDFEIMPEDPSIAGAPDFPAGYRVTVRNRKTGKEREYHSGSGSDWWIAFGKDLVVGEFD
jgi:hypothetical protein